MRSVLLALRPTVALLWLQQNESGLPPLDTTHLLQETRLSVRGPLKGIVWSLPSFFVVISFLVAFHVGTGTTRAETLTPVVCCVDRMVAMIRQRWTEAEGAETPLDEELVQWMQQSLEATKAYTQTAPHARVHIGSVTGMGQCLMSFKERR